LELVLMTELVLQAGKKFLESAVVAFEPQCYQGL
jgi:hypothetical protein